MAKFLESLGKPNAGRIELPGTVEGGDVILAGSVAFVGQSGRTNKEGVKQISNLLNAMEYEVRSTIVPAPYLHIGGAMSIIGPKLVLSCRGVFPDDFFNGFDKIEVSNNTFVSGNVIYLGDNEIIADISNIETIKELRRAKFTVHIIDLSEFVKGTGGPSCLIMPVERNSKLKRRI
jgi:dimethylargininase